MSVYAEVDISDALEHVTTREFYAGCIDEELWSAVRDIAEMMKDPTLRGMLGLPGAGGVLRGSLCHDDAILDSMLEESRQFNDFRMGEHIAGFLDAQRFRGIGVRR